MTSSDGALAETLLFLPGASGDTRVWKAVSDGLVHPAERRFVAWPGFGGAPPDEQVKSVDDVVARVAGSISGPTDLLAQSMGGVIALRVALEVPHLVKHLVLSVTSGGLDVAALGAADWRPFFRGREASVPSWCLNDRQDLTGRLGEVTAPVLLLWGDADPISPVAVGRRLQALLPHAELIVFERGTHDLVHERAADAVPHIARHLAR